ncbi:lytic polysaccharide monooxygenase [Actinoplanes sp. NPDC048796]|uniref:lytic polysaccharide monooxygenase n=1 Tax=Actinoplanes sp. NPDC048796 TaxID=3155640 RepID=UPI0033CDD4EF
MRREIAYLLMALGVTAGSTIAIAAPASAHGYVASPPSRQALCASGEMKDCGPIEYEPQSVEAPKGSNRCDGGVAQWSVLSDDSRNWPVQSVGTSVTFTWVLTVQHRTADFEYFVNGTRVASYDEHNEEPGPVSHTVDLSRFPGRQTVLAVWNIGDTVNAFYNCIDLDVSGGDGPAPADPEQPSPSSTAATQTPGAQSPDAQVLAAEPPTAAVPEDLWAADVSYQTGDVVTYDGARYQCRQSHVSINSWEPSIWTLALWLPL